MDLAFGTNVREHGYSIGRLAGIEADRKTHVVRNIVISADVGSDIERRPLVAVPADHFEGDIVLRTLPAAEEPVAPYEVLMLTDATRVMRGGRQIGRLSGVELSPETGEIVAIIGHASIGGAAISPAGAGARFFRAWRDSGGRRDIPGRVAAMLRSIR
jgi:hypothetical protein